MDWITPDWPAPLNVKAISTTRSGGFSRAPYDSLNLGDHVGDDPAVVAANRECLTKTMAMPRSPAWLNQIHGTEVVTLPLSCVQVPDADASFTDAQGEVCVVMTADCLPVLFCNEEGTRSLRRMRGGAVWSTVSSSKPFPISMTAARSWYGLAQRLVLLRLKWATKFASSLLRTMKAQALRLLRTTTAGLQISISSPDAAWLLPVLLRYMAAIFAPSQAHPAFFLIAEKVLQVVRQPVSGSVQKTADL